MESFKINNTDIILQDHGNNKGKIIISLWDKYNFSHYWGAMGGTLKEFLLSINVDYFVTKLCPAGRWEVFDGKKPATRTRKEIKEFLQWYEHRDFQKHMREEIKKIEVMEDEYEFQSWAESFIDNLDFYLVDRVDRELLKSDFEGMMCEWRNLIAKTDSPEAKFLSDLFPKIKKHLKQS